MCSLTLKKLIFEEKNSLWRKSGHSRWKKNTTTDIWEICSHWKKTLTLDKIWFYSYWRNLPTHIGACKTALTSHWSLYFFCLFKFLPFWLRLLSRRHDHHDHHISFIKLLFQTWNLLFFASVRLQRWYVTIPSSGQWWTTIENHRNQWLPDPKTIEKPLNPMVAPNHSIQWWWCL